MGTADSSAQVAASRAGRWLHVVGPGLLVAATGVGAGDLATAAFAGQAVGFGVLWAVIVGAVLKLVLTEGLARWQLATGETLLEGAIGRFGRGVGWAFLLYLAFWSFFVGSALISAAGVALQSLFPLPLGASWAKASWGVFASALGWWLARSGGFALVERLMSGLVLLMFTTVVGTAAIMAPDIGAFVAGMWPRLGAASPQLEWTAALIGGIGGTVTILCYGYWMREEGRRAPTELSITRIDLTVGYTVTAVFGLAMVIVGNRVAAGGSGAQLLVSIADELALRLGSIGRWAFLVGAAGAICSSLLGVWQAVPYLFADVWRMLTRPTEASPQAALSSKAYAFYAAALAVVPCLGLVVEFRALQKLYALVGVAFMPLLAVSLLVLNGRRKWVGSLRNGPLNTVALALTLAFFVAMAWRRWVG